MTGIIDEAESRGRLSLARLFTEERAAKVVEVREMIAQVRARLAAPLAPGGQHQVIRGPVGNLPLQPEVKQWQRAVNEGWKQKL